MPSNFKNKNIQGENLAMETLYELEAFHILI